MSKRVAEATNWLKVYREGASPELLAFIEDVQKMEPKDQMELMFLMLAQAGKQIELLYR